MTLGGRRIPLGTYDTEDEAWQAVEVALDGAQRGTVVATGEATLRKIGTSWLAQRERGGIADSDGEERRWSGRVLTYPIADMPLRAVTQADVEAYLVAVASDTSRETAQRCLALVRGCLRSAVGRHIKQNPAVGARLPGRRQRVDRWSYLDPEKQSRLLTCETVPEDDRIVMAFAIGTGIRQGEHAAIEWPDLDIERATLTVSKSRNRGTTKAGKSRHVPLFGLGLAAAQMWTVRHGRKKGLMFPAPDGGMRASGHFLGQTDVKEGKKRRKVDVWKAHLERAGLSRDVRWHDLRHTCASSLVSGWWGRRWSIEEVAAYIGDTIAAAQIYAHLGDSALRKAANGTVSIGSSSDWDSLESAVICLVGQPGLEPGTDGLKVPKGQLVNREDPNAWNRNGTETLAVEYLEAVRRDDPRRDAIGVRLAEGVLAEGVLAEVALAEVAHPRAVCY